MADEEEREPGSPRALLAGVLCVLLGFELVVATIVPTLVGYAIVSFLMPMTACEVLTDGWLQKQLLRLDAFFEGRERAALEAFSPLWVMPRVRERPHATGARARKPGDGGSEAS